MHFRLRIVPLRFTLVALLVATAAAGCGGGGGGGSPPPPPAPTFSLATHALTYTATSSTAATPAAQTVSGSVTGSLSGTLYIVVTVAGPAVDTVSAFSVSGSSGQASVSVKAPSALGPGTYSSTITVHACSNDSTCATGELAGSPQTVTVSYTIDAPTLADLVAPHAISTAASGNVVLRGHGFTGTSAVSFGGATASAFSVVSDSLITATYPAGLAVGTQVVTLTGGTSSFAGNVVVVGPQAYAATTLAYPHAPGRVLQVVFDAARQMLYVAVEFQGDPQAGQVWTYAYSNGAWAPAAIIPIIELRDVALSLDGSTLYALTSTAVLEYPASNPSAGPARTVTAPFAASVIGAPCLVRFAFANDGTALVATGIYGSGAVADVYAYQAVAGTFADLGNAWRLATAPFGALGGTYTGSLVASGDGSFVLATHNDPSATPVGFGYDAVAGIMQAAPVALNQIPDQPAALDDAAAHIVVTDGTTTEVLTTSAITGGIPPPLGNGAFVLVTLVNSQGTRLYTVTADNQLHSFDLTAVPSGQPAMYPEIGTAIAFTPPRITSPTLRTAMTPDGETLFIAGDGGVAVVPAPQ